MVAAFWCEQEIGAVVEINERRVDGSEATAMCRIVAPATRAEYIASELARGMGGS